MRREAAAGSEPTTGESPSAQEALILAVDDEREALDFLREFLTGAGFEFAEATSGAQALRVIAERRPDLIIADVVMAGMTGFELCDLLRSDIASRDIPIIIYSAHETRAYSNAGLYDLAYLKPADPDELLWGIRALLASWTA
ncbi:MAG TPA: response regulator [Steroidobacteraceae bacterium]|nr:response regulator [Steroidobacteraceae bacterium]